MKNGNLLVEVNGNKRYSAAARKDDECIFWRWQRKTAIVKFDAFSPKENGEEVEEMAKYLRSKIKMSRLSFVWGRTYQQFWTRKQQREYSDIVYYKPGSSRASLQKRKLKVGWRHSDVFADEMLRKHQSGFQTTRYPSSMVTAKLSGTNHVYTPGLYYNANLVGEGKK